MALGINETIENEVYKSKHLVYADGVRYKFPTANKEIVACILPAIADPSDKASYLPYRDEEDLSKFTKWAVGVKIHPFVNKEQNILSPQTHDPSAYDPIDELIKVAKNDPQYCLIAGFGPDGKRVPNAYKNAEVRLSAKWTGYVVNAIVLHDRDCDPDKAVALQIPGTAFRKVSRGSNDGGQSWGLLSELERKNRGKSGDSIDDYYWGDITDPRALIPCILKLTPNPAGGISIYNMVPDSNADAVTTTKSVLESRYDLDKVFLEITEGEIIDRLVYYFSDVPGLLKRAFAHRIPNFDKKLKEATAVRSTHNVTEAEVDEVIEDTFQVSRKPTRRREEELDDAEESRDFAPPIDSDLPVATRKPSRAAVEEEEEDGDEEIKPRLPQRKKAASSGAGLSMKDLMD